ncbi:uncharacterized protein [Amphiura filiformis]|uniref:uncharacterized protein n=1 Tax=Amphiura filiformis TaxID=82378 RepID=UPI003B20C406
MEKYSSKVPTTDPARHPFFARRPKSSPSLRSNSTVNERPQTGPSYQQRRLQRHGSTKFSRPTTAVLRQHSQDLLYHNNGGQKLFRSKSFINSHQSSAPSSSRIEAWDVKDTKTPSTTVDSKPALLRPHTAVLLRRRLRHIVKNRIKSAHPAVESNSFVSGYSDVEEEAQFGTRIIDLEKRDVNVSSTSETGVSKQNTSASNDTGAAAGTFEESPAVATSKQSDGDAPTTIIGWGSSKSKSVHAFTDVSEKLLKRPVPKTSNENDDDLHQLSGNKQASQYDGEGSTAAHTGVVESKSPPTLTITQSNTPSNELSPSAAGPLSTGEQNHHEILRRSLREDHDKQSFQAIGSPAESCRSSTPPLRYTPDNTDEYVPAAPELRLGYAEYSIPLTTSDLGKSHSKSAQNQAHHRKASVVSMMKRNRHSRHNRLSVYLKTATTRTGESALEKFRRLCKTIRVIAGICIALKSYVKEGKTKQWSLVEMQLNLKADMEKALTFDPLMFSNLHVSRGSHKLKIILSKLPKHRTQRDVDVVVALLRKNRTFANCHRDTQLELAKVMEYQRFEPRRIVLKEGHAASCYYIILSGVCLVNQLDFDRRNNSQFVTTVKEIGPGDCFGEVALLTDSVRECSIICKEEVELLLVNKDDFMSIIRIPMENEQKELVKYCVLRSVFTDEMFGNIKSTYKTIFRHYYKPGTVISKDLNKDEYIYVIKVGNCRVLSEVLEPRKKKESASKSMSDDSWKKKAALKRSMSLLGGSKRRVGWAEYAKKKIEKEEVNFQTNTHQQLEVVLILPLRLILMPSQPASIWQHM